MATDRIGKYRIIAKLGQGGMATVFLSVVPGPVGFNKLLVVKILKDDLSQDADFLAMFLNEARLAARLNHANVVQTYEVGIEGSTHFLAMDYLDGQPLHAVLRRATRARMPLDIHVRILADALAGLHYAHTLKDFDGTPFLVVHRDVSPQNVFVTYDGQTKVVDFGIAKAAGASSNTASGVFKGKLAYVAPEQAAGSPTDARSDLFSVGVMLWEAMAGHRFAQGEAQTAILARRLAGTEPRIRDVAPDADAELADICDKAMAHDPKDRFETAQAFRDALDNFLDRFSRRVGSREVGDYMAGLFGEERERIRLIIDEQMKRLQRETSESLPVPTLDVHQVGGETTPVTKIEGRGAPKEAVDVSPATSPSGSHGTLVTAHISQGPPPARSAAPTILLGLSALALASVVGVGMLLFLRAPAGPRDVAGASGSGTATSSVPNAERARLSITFGPAGATAKLDGVALPESPFVAQVPRDGSMHRIEFSGAGLVPETRMLSYDKDVSITVSLTPEEPNAAGSASSGPAVAPTGVGRMPKNPKQPHEIDEKDPYKK